MKRPRKRIKDIYSRTIIENPGAVYRGMRDREKKTVRVILRVLLAIAGCAAVLLLLRGTALPAVEQRLGITAEDLIEKHGNIFLCIVYSPLDDWGKETAESLRERLSGIDDLKSAVITDEEFTDPSREPFPGERYSASGEKTDGGGYCLAVVIGHTVLSSEDYVAACLRLGTDGYEIFNRSADGRLPEAVVITAFESGSAAEAADRFADYFLSADHFTRLFGRMYLTRRGKNIPDAPVYVSAGEDFNGILTVSRPSAAEASLDSLGRMIDASKPAAVLFNGGLACGCTSAEDIASSWDAIAALLEKKGVGAFCLFSHADGSLPSSVTEESLRETVSGRLGGDSFICAGGGWMIFTSDGVTPVCALLICTDAAADASFYRVICRAAGRTVPGAAVFPGVTAAALRSPVGETSDPGYLFGIYEIPDRYLGSAFDALFGKLLETGLPCVFFAGNNNAGVFDCEFGGYAGTVAFCGSVDRDSYGLGGRLDLNNSLRGGILLEADGDAFRAVFLRAADCPEGEAG